MKKALRWVVRVVVLLVVVAACLVGYVAVTGIPHYPTKAIDLHVEVTPARVVRGKELALALCVDCHKSAETRQLTGHVLQDSPPEFGHIASKNITKDPVHGIGARTDGELAFLLRTGIRWDGQYIPPYMARLPNMGDEDLLSIIAFLRSDDDLVRASDVVTEPSRPSFLVKFLSHVAFFPTPYPTSPITPPPVTDEVAHGKYLVAALECFACHSADFKTMNELVPEKSAGYLGGGNMLLQMNGLPIYSANLTPDDETGIGAWTEAEFRRALKTGFRKDGSLIRYPMNRMDLGDDEADAIYAYLRTVPKIHKARPVTPADPPANDASPGAALYHQYACHTCHGETGLSFGDLRPAKVKYPTNDALTAFLKAPAASLPGTKMPAWDGVIKEADYGPLDDYVHKLASAN